MSATTVDKRVAYLVDVLNRLPGVDVYESRGKCHRMERQQYAEGPVETVYDVFAVWFTLDVNPQGVERYLRLYSVVHDQGRAKERGADLIEGMGDDEFRDGRPTYALLGWGGTYADGIAEKIAEACGI